MGELTEVADGVWLACEPVRIVGTRLSASMAVLRQADGTLLLWSPVPATPERRAAVRALGEVTDLYAPNTFHHLWIAEWAEAYPDARLHAPAALAAKRGDLRIARSHGAPWRVGLEELRVDGFRLHESALYHPASRTLVVADLVHHVGRPGGAWTGFYGRLMGFYDRVAISRAIRWTAFSDRRAARRSVDAILALPFERVVVGHGAPVVDDAADALASAYAWL